MEETPNITSKMDIRMLLLLELLKEYGEIRFEKEFCEPIGLLHQNLAKIRKGENHFTAEHVRNAVRHFKINGNWMFETEKKLFRNTRKSTLLKRIN